MVQVEYDVYIQLSNSVKLGDELYTTYGPGYRLQIRK